MTADRRWLASCPDGVPSDYSFPQVPSYFTIVDRKKNLIIAGGFNIHPAELESGPR